VRGPGTEAARPATDHMPADHDHTSDAGRDASTSIPPQATPCMRRMQGPAAGCRDARRAAAPLSAHARSGPRTALLAAQCEASNAPARLPQKRGRQPWRHRVAWLLQRRPPPPASKPPAAATRGRTSDPRPLPHRSIVQPILGLERRPRRTLLCGAASAALAWRRSSAPHNPVAAGCRRAAAARMQRQTCAACAAVCIQTPT